MAFRKRESISFPHAFFYPPLVEKKHEIFSVFRLARQYTNCEDVVVTEDAFHGNLGVLIDISPKMHQYVPDYKPKDFVHVSPLPSSYRLSEMLSDLVMPSDLSGDKRDQWIAIKCAEQVEAIFLEAKKQGRGIAAFICEPCFVSLCHAGAKIHIYPKIHILKIPIFTKFMFLKPHFSQNSHFGNLNFHKIHISEILFFT